MDDPTLPRLAAGRSGARLLRATAHITFTLFLILLLAANSIAADGGPLTWLPLIDLPVAGGGWETIGMVALLPVLSAIAWWSARRLAPSSSPLSLGWPRLAWLGVAVFALAYGRLALTCATSACSAGPILRLTILLLLLCWVYLFVVNEQPDLLWVIGPVLVVQSSVAIAQFVTQADVGLHALGERVLDPAVSGISIVIRDDLRWLRGYGLTVHPNVLARTLVPALLLLPILARGATPRRQAVIVVLFLVGMAGMMVTLSRWAWACLLLGLAINGLPYLRQLARRRTPQLPRATIIALVTVLAIALLFMAVYGDTVVGRTEVATTPTEAMSVNERQRDLALSWQMLQSSPLYGVGYETYLATARALDPAADVVHNIPLLWGVELGIVGIVLWLALLVAPLCRRGVLGRYAPYTALWLGFWLMGLLYIGPNPLVEVRSTLMAGFVAGVMAWSATDNRRSR